MEAFEPIWIGKVKLKNRIIRSGTYEGCSDESGYPGEGYNRIYKELAMNEVGAIITGFAFTSNDGKAMQVAQAGLEKESKIGHFEKITAQIHKYDCPVFMQISHAGRQTTEERTSRLVSAPSRKPSRYFQSRPGMLSTNESYEKIAEYANTASYAKMAGFDGVQVHAAHGYLVHQFLLANINKRKDEFGINKSSGIGSKFLEEIIIKIREQCGPDFPILVKVSCGIDLRPGFGGDQFRELISFLNKMKVDGIEVSYGTMDHPLNIFRGDFPLDLIMANNPFFKHGNKIKKSIKKLILYHYRGKRIPFSPTYNLEYAKIAKHITNIPIISVGGFRSSDDINVALRMGFTDIIGMSRPFICEPDLLVQLKRNNIWNSGCINCNICAVMCDSGKPTICYKPAK